MLLSAGTAAELHWWKTGVMEWLIGLAMFSWLSTEMLAPWFRVPTHNESSLPASNQLVFHGLFLVFISFSYDLAGRKLTCNSQVLWLLSAFLFHQNTCLAKQQMSTEMAECAVCYSPAIYRCW